MLDTNVVVSAFVSPKALSPPSLLVEAALAGTLRFLVSDELLAEYRNVLLREKHARRHRLMSAEIDRLIVRLVTQGSVVQTTGTEIEGPDPKDAHLWRILRAEPSATLITGDKRLVDHAPQGTKVLTPRAWLNKVSKQRG